MTDAKADVKIPCLLCGEGLEIRTTYKEKPYLVCDACGVQVFIRGSVGVKRLAKMVDKIILEKKKGGNR